MRAFAKELTTVSHQDFQTTVAQARAACEGAQLIIAGILAEDLADVRVEINGAPLVTVQSALMRRAQRYPNPLVTTRQLPWPAQRGDRSPARTGVVGGLPQRQRGPGGWLVTSQQRFVTDSAAIRPARLQRASDTPWRNDPERERTSDGVKHARQRPMMSGSPDASQGLLRAYEQMRDGRMDTMGRHKERAGELPASPSKIPLSDEEVAAEDRALLAHWLATSGSRPTDSDRERWISAARQGRLPRRRLAAK